MKRIAQVRAKFISRGDNSGTHQKEVELWKAAAVDPQGDWYIVTKDFMTASLKRADAERGYFLTDSSTFVAERKATPNLQLSFRGGALLMNPYHTLWLTQPSEGTPLAQKFAAYLMSDEVQASLRSFGKDRYGEAMYNDAKVSRERWPEGQ